MKINIVDQSDIINHYGITNQLGIAMEECAELIQAISKMNRTDGDAEDYMKAKLHLEEEIADVVVCINQLQSFFNITDARISELANYKINRQRGRMSEEGSDNK